MVRIERLGGAPNHPLPLPAVGQAATSHVSSPDERDRSATNDPQGRWFLLSVETPRPRIAKRVWPMADIADTRRDDA
jgi:hypothetical protein